MTTTYASIKTKYHGATNTKGSRVSVTDDYAREDKPRRLVVNWDYALNTNENHAKAAKLWIKKFIEYPGVDVQLSDVGLGFRGEYFWTWTFNQKEGGER